MDVVKYYGLKVVGNKSICPFHNDKNPSFVINEKKNIATCFSCGTKGNVISFVQKYEKIVNNNEISTNEAIAKVVDICNLNIDVSKLNSKKDYYQYKVASRKYTEEEIEMIKVNEFLNKLFTYNLKHSKNDALNYLHERGVSDKIINELSVGYAPKNQLIKSTDDNPKLPLSTLIQLGYIRQNNNGDYYETFRDRVMIPIYDEKGNIVSFCGRTINNEDPKYLHTIETPIFHKNELLYNFSNANTLAYNNELILVEGYMDVIGAKKLGFENVSAIMGTNISDEQLSLIRRNHSSITLALDNDEAGKKAMLNNIPLLLEKGFNVHVIDISKLGDYKDFGDLGNTDLKYMDIQKFKISGFDYLLNNKYFNELELNSENIYFVYKKLKNDKIIKNTYDESLFKDYIVENTNYTKYEINEIIYPKDLDEKNNPFGELTSKAMTNYLFYQIKREVERKNDKILFLYFEKYQPSIEKRIIDIFNQNVSKYIEETNSSLKTETLLLDVISNNKEYSIFESLNRFQYVDVLENVYIKNMNGSARIKLDEKQRQKVIKQYETTLTDEEKLSLEEVEELYIINDIDDIDGILSYNNNTLNILKENIKERMFLNIGKMDFFKFGSLFFNLDKDFIGDIFKGKTGNYKTVLFYNNLDNSLNLDKNNLMSNDEINKLKEKKQKEEEIKKDYLFSINHILIVPSLETETHYFVRIPGTGAKEYFYIPKSECEWSDNGEIIFTRLFNNETYPIYNRSGEFISNKSFEELKSYWEDKTKTKDAIKDEYNLKKDIENFTFNNHYESKYKEPIFKIYNSRITLETSRGFYFKINEPDVLLFAPKKICSWNDNQNYLIVTPKKNKIFNSSIEKYKVNGYKRTLEKKLSFEELEKYVQIIYPKEFNNKDNINIKIAKENCEFINNFVRIPIAIEDMFGYFEVNIIKCKVDEHDVYVELLNNEQITFYDIESKQVYHYNSKVIEDNYKKMVNDAIKFSSNYKNQENILYEKEAS